MESIRYPEGVPFSINYPKIPLYAFLENSARKFPNRDATIFYDQRLSYNEVWDKTLRFAFAIREFGVKNGERVGLFMPNVPQFIIAFYGTLVAGGVVVPVNPYNSTEEIERELEETNALSLVTLDRLVYKLPKKIPEKLIVSKSISYVPARLKLLSRFRKRPQPLPKDSIDFDKLIIGPTLEYPSRIEPKNSLATIIYTSGTTGKPKGVMLTHMNLVANALQSYHWLRSWGFSSKPQLTGWPIVICAVPFFHSYGLTICLNEPIQFGSSLVLIPEPNAETIMKGIQKYKSTHFPSIPRFISEILSHKHLRRYDITSLTSVLSGGASIDPSLVEKFISVTGAQFYQGYGLTEAGPSTHCTPYDAIPNYQTVGLPFPDTEAKIVDLQLGTIDAAQGEKGELIVRGPQIMKGYWKDPEMTAKVLKEGWLYTGDIMIEDEEGFFYFIGRKRDKIITRGRSVWPTEVEKVLKSYPRVKTAVAFGVLDPLRCTNDIRVLVTLEDCSQKNIEDELLEYCYKHLEYYQIPTSIDVVDSLPLTPMGKVDRVTIEAKTQRQSQGNLDQVLNQRNG
jgi:long-chain acyl-CoA synthetase